MPPSGAAPYLPYMSHQKDDAIRDLLNRASCRKFEARHGDAPVYSLGEDVLDDYPEGWLEARLFLEEEFRSEMEAEYRQAMREAAPAAWEFGP